MVFQHFFENKKAGCVRELVRHLCASPLGASSFYSKQFLGSFNRQLHAVDDIQQGACEQRVEVDLTTSQKSMEWGVWGRLQTLTVRAHPIWLGAVV